MQVRLETETVESGSYKDKQRNGEDTPFLRLIGYTLPAGRWSRCICRGEVAVAALDALRTDLAPGEEVGTKRHVIEVEGDSVTRIDSKTREPVVTFEVTALRVLAGPGAELARIQRAGARALEEAGRARSGGDLERAYLLLEEWAAAVARRPRPSAGIGPIAANDAEIDLDGISPEELAARRYVAEDGQTSAMAAPASVVERQAAEAAVSATPEESGSVSERPVAEDSAPVESGVEEPVVAAPLVEKSVAEPEEAVTDQPAEAEADRVEASGAESAEPEMGGAVDSGQVSDREPVAESAPTDIERDSGVDAEVEMGAPAAAASVVAAVDPLGDEVARERAAEPVATGESPAVGSGVGHDASAPAPRPAAEARSGSGPVPRTAPAARTAPPPRTGTPAPRTAAPQAAPRPAPAAAVPSQTVADRPSAAAGPTPRTLPTPRTGPQPRLMRQPLSTVSARGDREPGEGGPKP